MNKDIHKYISNCALCKKKKARTQVYPLQMTDLTNRPFDKGAIDLVSDLNVSASGNLHILTIIDHLTGWPEAFHISEKRAHAIVHVFINKYLPIHMGPCFILSNNGTEFKNQLMDDVLQQFGIDHIFSTTYLPQSNGKLDVFQKYLKPAPKKSCKKNPDNWDKHINQVLASYHVTPNLATAETQFFPVYGRDPNFPLHQLLEPMQQFLGDPDSGHLDLESHHPALVIAMNTLDENHFKHAQKMIHHTPPNFKVGNRVFFKTKQPGKWGLKWRAGHRIFYIECNRHYPFIENQATGKTRVCNVKDVVHKLPVQLWNVDTMFGRAG